MDKSPHVVGINLRNSQKCQENLNTPKLDLLRFYMFRKGYGDIIKSFILLNLLVLQMCLTRKYRCCVSNVSISR